MNHIPNWQVWEGGAGHIWVGYTDEKSGFQAPRIEVIWKGKFPNADEAKALGQKTVSALNSYPALVAAAEAGGKYADALLSLQDQFPLVKGTTIQGVDLDALFQDWHDKTHAAIKIARGE